MRGARLADRVTTRGCGPQGEPGPRGEKGDTGDQAVLERIFADNDIETVMHFAAHTQVPESVTDPLKYYRNNTCATRNLLECCVEANVKHFVFSSTAASRVSRGVT